MHTVKIVNAAAVSAWLVCGMLKDAWNICFLDGYRVAIQLNKEYCAVKKLLTSTVFFLFCCGVANAEEISLTTNDIDTLINGKTINGVHYGKKTIQYFSKSGLTLWIGQGDEQPTEGQWKVENDQYCSKFGSDWACFDIVFDKAQNIHYFIGEGFRAPFVVAQEFSLNF